MSVIQGYAPAPHEWVVSNQPFIRDFINAFRPASAVMTFINEKRDIYPPRSIRDELRKLAARGQYSLSLCLEYLKVPLNESHFYNVTISRHPNKDQTRIQIDNYPAIVF